MKALLLAVVCASVVTSADAQLVVDVVGHRQVGNSSIGTTVPVYVVPPRANDDRRAIQAEAQALRAKIACQQRQKAELDECSDEFADAMVACTMLVALVPPSKPPHFAVLGSVACVAGLTVRYHACQQRVKSC